MLNRHQSRQQLERALDELQPHLRLKPITNSIEIFLTGKFPEVSLHLYSFLVNNGGETKFWFCVKKFMQRIEIYVGTLGVFLAEEFQSALTKVLCECPVFEELSSSTIGHVIADSEATRKEIQSVLEKCQAVFIKSVEHFIGITKPSMQSAQLRKVPEGFTLRPLRFEDIDHVIALTKSFWSYEKDDEAETLRCRLSRLPSAAIIDQRTNMPASFLYLEHNGMLTSLYTVPEYRDRKLGAIVSDEIVTRCQNEFGICPWFGISPSNTPVLATTAQSQKILTPNGEQQKIYGLFTKMESFRRPCDLNKSKL